MNCVQALAVALAALVVAAQSEAPLAKAHIAALTAEAQAFSANVNAEFITLADACTQTVTEPRDQASTRRLPDSFIHLTSRSARL